MSIVGNRLRMLRESIRFSQTNIADMVELTQSSINRYENGYAEAPYKVLLGGRPPASQAVILTA